MPDRKDIERFVDLVPRLDNVGQVISAGDINILQELAEALQREALRQQDEDFLQTATQALENHPDLNAMWVELLRDGLALDMHNSLGVYYSAGDYSVRLRDEATVGFATSKRYTPPSNCNVKKVLLFADYVLPEGDELKFELSNNGLDFYPVEPNTGEVTTLKTDGSALYVRVKFRRQPGSAGPQLNAWAVLYYDATLQVDLDERAELDLDFEGLDLPPPPPPPQIKPQLYHSELLGIGPDDHHPKIHRHSGEPGENDKIDLISEVKNILWWDHLPPELAPPEGYIRLVRDPSQDDRLVRVEGERFTVELTYSGEKLLQALTTVGGANGETASTAVTSLDWQPYAYADGSTEEVLAGVNIQRTEVRA